MLPLPLTAAILVCQVANAISEGVTVSGVACDVRHLPRHQLLIAQPLLAGSAPLLPGEFELYDGIVFGASGFGGKVYVEHGGSPHKRVLRFSDLSHLLPLILSAVSVSIGKSHPVC